MGVVIRLAFVVAGAALVLSAQAGCRGCGCRKGAGTSQADVPAEPPVLFTPPKPFRPGDCRWAHRVRADEVGLESDELTRVKALSGSLGRPVQVGDRWVIKGFHYATFAPGSPEATRGDTEDQLVELGKQGRAQRLLTLAAPMVVAPLSLLNGDKSAQPRALLPVPPMVKVKPPLVVEQMPDLQVHVGTSAPGGSPDLAFLRGLVDQARAAGQSPAGLLLGLFEGDSWCAEKPRPVETRPVVQFMVQVEWTGARPAAAPAAPTPAAAPEAAAAAAAPAPAPAAVP